MSRNAKLGEMAESERIRSFVALDTPKEWKERLGTLQKELQSELPESSIRWINPTQIHLTLRFFGWIDQAEVDQAGLILHSVCSGIRPFQVVCKGIGCFPSIKKPRVIWAGISGADAALQELYSRVNEATRTLGEAPEDRPFTPHLTLGRVKEFERTGLSVLQKVAKYEFDFPWRIDQVQLMRSHLFSHGAHYERLNSFRSGNNKGSEASTSARQEELLNAVDSFPIDRVSLSRDRVFGFARFEAAAGNGGLNV